MWTYAQFDEYLGEKWDRPVPKNFGSPRSTRIVRCWNGDIAIKYHATNVVCLSPSGTYTVNTGGWYSVTTKRRINTFSPITVYQKNWTWYYGNGERYHDHSQFDSWGKPL